MLDKEKMAEMPLYRALRELNDALEKRGTKPFTLNTVGGFALMIHSIREDIDAYTDIDYIGKDFSPEVKDIINQIGVKYNFEADWINNDVVLSGSSLENMQFATGELHFLKAFDMSVISVNVLDLKDLLRMKVLAIDTAIMAHDNGGNFTRNKDFPDIINLAKELRYTIDDIKENTKDLVLEPYTYKALHYCMDEMEKGNNLAFINIFDPSLREKISEKYKDDSITEYELLSLSEDDLGFLSRLAASANKNSQPDGSFDSAISVIEKACNAMNSLDKENPKKKQPLTRQSPFL